MRKNIQVLYIITKLELGGAQKVCLSLLQGLRSHGNTALMIAGAQGILDNQVKQQPHVILLPTLTREVSLKTLFLELKNFIHLIRKIRRLKRSFPDLMVHTHSTKAGIIGRWAAWCAGITTRIHTVHGFGFHAHQSWLSWSILYSLELVTSFITTHYVCVSSADVTTGKRLLPRFSTRHSIIRAAVDVSLFTHHSIPSFPHHTPFVFGTVSCFKEQKNIIDLLKAFKVVYQHNPQARLEIIGDGILRPVLEQWIADNQCERVITLHGWQKDVAPFLQQWHCFVLSSLWEGLPCAVVEARLLKLPVIAYNTGGIHDVIFHHHNGLLVQPRNWQDLAHQMRMISTSPDRHEAYAHYHDNLDEFNNDVMVDRHAQLYHALTP